MNAADHLAGLEPYGELGFEAARLEAFFESLADADWERPSRCEGWSTRDMLAHLASAEGYHHACLDDELDAFVQRYVDAGGTDIGSFNEIGIREYDDKAPPEILRTWRAASAETRRRMRERDGGTMTTMVPDYPVRQQAFHVASELATHADDIGVPVSPDEEARRTAWRAPFSRFVLAEESRDVVVEPHDGEHVVRAGGVEARLSDHDFVEAVAGRLPPGHALPDALRAALSTAV